MPTYRTPGVYVEEISTLPPSVAEVATAVPAFIGYTETGPSDSEDPVILRLATMLEFQTAFGGAYPTAFEVTETIDPNSGESTLTATRKKPANGAFSLYYALSHYFRNGGGPCYVVSVGNYGSLPNVKHFEAGLAALEKEDEPTLIVLTDAACLLGKTDYCNLGGAALAQCKKLGDRFTILDVQDGDWQGFRNDAGLAANLLYGAAYHPYLQTSMSCAYRDTDVTVSRAATGNTSVSGSLTLGGDNGIVVRFTGPSGSTPGVEVDYGLVGEPPGFEVSGGTLKISNVKSSTAEGAAKKTAESIVAKWAEWVGDSNNDAAGFDIAKNGDGSSEIASKDIARTELPLFAPDALAAIKSTETALYNRVKSALADQRVVLPPSAAMAGIYARVDREQGVWKAPANVGVMSVIGPVRKITNDDQDRLNIDSDAGKSINAIREFTGKGTLVWGARTLAGNDNEWRYVSVRRLFITIEESTRKASAFAVFESNDQSTWLKVKAMIESYLYGLWEQGALAGAKPEAAYFVHVGLGTTMTPQDVLEGRMIVEIGVAAVRPAEFIILRFSHKLQTA